MPTTIGIFERVAFPEFGIRAAIAKIDTGAYTGALHCSIITERNDDEGKVLVFKPLESDQLVQRENFVIRYVKSSNGAYQKRYFIDTQIDISGVTYPIILSLTDRSGMRWPVLIGRRFLRRNHFLVDVKKKGPAFRKKIGAA